MMDEFTRTGIGLSNYPFFLNTEKVYFCEGEVPRGGHSDPCQTVDTALWEAILTHRYSETDFKLVPCGSKSEVIHRLTLSAEAERQMGRKPRTFGCIDRDYDDFSVSSDLSGILDRLLVTEGYSAENDLLSLVGTTRLMRFLAPRLSRRDQLEGEQRIVRLSRVLGRIRRIDSHFRARGIEFLPTDGLPPFIGKMNSNSLSSETFIPSEFRKFKAAHLSKHGFANLAESRTLETRMLVHSIVSLNGLLYCPGKTVIKAVCHVINLFCSKVPNWVKLGPSRLVDHLLGLFQAACPAAVCGLISNNPRSWASIR